LGNDKLFWVSKRFIDIFISIILLPIFLLSVIILFLINRIFNPGTIFYTQNRMGKNCQPFKVIKFRSMRSVEQITREYNDPIETERITPLGNILRQTRLDEIPQIINVIKGDMSLIGPRPDYYEHALEYILNIPKYQARYVIRPGISGLSQIRLGYAEGLQATRAKTSIDHYYIRNASFYLDAKIFFATILIVFNRSGN
jgi:lipopolysaccharide/colanic/teichoic acid biosynthesis glycosyltransferase